MSRKQQDLLTWILAAGLLVSQLFEFVPHRPELVAGAFGLLGLPTIRKFQDIVNREEGEDRPQKGAKK